MSPLSALAALLLPPALRAQDPPAAPEAPGCAVAEGERLAAPRVAGALDPATVREAVVQQLERLRPCTTLLAADPQLRPGQAVARLSVTPAGRVFSAELIADGIGVGEPALACLLTAFGRMIFPEAGAGSWICYPIEVALPQPADPGPAAPAPPLGEPEVLR